MDKLLHVDQIGCNLADRLLQTWVHDSHLDLLGYVWDVLATVAAVDHSVVLKHLHHVLGQLRGVVAQLSHVLRRARYRGRRAQRLRVAIACGQLLKLHFSASFKALQVQEADGSACFNRFVNQMNRLCNQVERLWDHHAGFFSLAVGLVLLRGGRLLLFNSEGGVGQTWIAILGLASASRREHSALGAGVGLLRFLKSAGSLAHWLLQRAYEG